MALGRSNSLSLNTSAVNSSFAAQQGQQPANAAGSLFGGASTAAKPANSIFGQSINTNTTQPATGSLGSAPAAGQTSSLFGAKPAQSSSLFGGGQAQPAQQSSLFGGSLFGGQAKPAESKPAFPSLGASQPAQASTGGLFGSQSTAQPASGGLFGASTTTQPNATMQNGVNQPSLLSASRYSLGQSAPFTGRLSMGQGSAAQISTTSAVKINWDTARPTTRFEDLTDSAKAELEAIDKLIQQQEAFARQIEAFLPVHGTNMASLEPDIKLITEKVQNVEEALVTDAQGVQQAKTLTTNDATNVGRIERVGENLKLPAQYHYAPAARSYRSATEASDNRDTDLVSNYFSPAAGEMRRTIERYQNNLAEIESHIQTIEASTVAQAQNLGQQRARGGNANDTVAQLADTLRGFEGTILQTAAKVGAAREAVTELTLRRP